MRFVAVSVECVGHAAAAGGGRTSDWDWAALGLAADAGFHECWGWSGDQLRGLETVLVWNLPLRRQP